MRNWQFFAQKTWQVGLLAALLLAGCQEPDPETARCKAAPELAALPPLTLNTGRWDVALRQMHTQLANEPATPDACQHTLAQAFPARELRLFGAMLEQAPLRALDSVPQQALAQALGPLLCQHYARDTAFIQFIDSVQAALPPTFALDSALAPSLRRLKAARPGMAIPPLRAVVFGYMQGRPWYYGWMEDPVTFTDDYWVLGLEYYTGPDFPYHHPEMPQYLRARCTPRHLPVTVLRRWLTTQQPPLAPLNKAQSGQGPPTPPTLLDHAIHGGIRLAALDQLLPCTPDSTKFYATGPQMAWCHQFYPAVYKEMLPYLFSHKKKEWDYFIEDGPQTAGYAEEAPSRLGLYVGWEIVRSYLDRHPEETALGLLERTDYHALFKASGFKP